MELFKIFFKHTHAKSKTELKIVLHEEEKSGSEFPSSVLPLFKSIEKNKLCYLIQNCEGKF